MTERKAKARAKQIPFGNDRKKSKGKSKRRFPSGMTKEEQEQTQIPFGNDKQNRG
jgi:ribosomal protein L28